MENFEKKALTNEDGADNLWQRLKDEAAKIEYGVLECRFTVHQGIIQQVDITQAIKRIRAD